jgi:hypothetical protein
MSLNIIAQPEKTINGLLTDVVAVEAQALYEMQRQDNQMSSSFISGGDLNVTIIFLSIFCCGRSKLSNGPNALEYATLFTNK